jgi:hypothetical protein
VEERLMDLVKKESGQMVDQDLENSYMQQFMKQSELDIMQEAIERSIMEQSIREYYSKK